MRTTVSFLSFIILLMILGSCNDDNQRSYVQYYHPKPGVMFASNSTAGTARNPAHGQPGHRCDIAVGDPLPVSASLPATSKDLPVIPQPAGNLATQIPPPIISQNSLTPAAGINPAHGKPGHRCDIAVGAPLNSSPAATSAITTTLPTGALPKLNPAHGQPGHRCDIAVGAPLNAPPGKTNPSTPVKPAVTKTLSREDSLAIWNSLPMDSTGARLNPAHGQSGHDCSIAVGKPLKQPG
jgi:hypothetical protein